MTEALDTDYLVIGSGIAGLNFALLAAEHGRVVVVTKKKPADTNTNWAQGGVAAVLAPDDSIELHIQDTLTAGDGLCDRAVVEMCVSEGAAQVQRLLDVGVRLARDQPARSTSAAKVPTRATASCTGRTSRAARSSAP